MSEVPPEVETSSTATEADHHAETPATGLSKLLGKRRPLLRRPGGHLLPGSKPASTAAESA